MIVLDIYEADDFGAADKVERIEGTYNGKAFELDRVYSDYNEEDDTYGLIEVEWYDGDSSLTDEELEDTIIERFWDMDYVEKYNQGGWYETPPLIHDFSENIKLDETEFKLPSEQDILQKPIENTLTKTTESILKDLDKYGFSQISNILHYMIDDVGPEITGEAISIIVEKEMHYNIQTCIQHICDKWLTDEEFYKTTKLTTNFIDTYIKIYNNRLPNLKKHITRKADQNFDDAIAADAIKNGYYNYLVKDPEDWKNLKGPVGLAVQLCGCKNFNQIIETEAQKEFKKHFLNIFFFTLKEIENLPAFYKENLSAMLVTSIEALYHDDELCWGLEKEEGVLTHPLGALLDLEYGLDFNAYITEDQVPLYYGGEDLVLFGVNGISNVEYPVNYRQMAADLLVKISEKKYRI